MRHSLIFSAICAAALSACGSSEPAAEKADATTTANSEASPVITTYVRVRDMASVGDIEGAAALTDNPQAYLQQMNIALDRMGEDIFKQNMKNAALTTNIDSEKRSGDYAMLIINYSFQGHSQKIANFFRQSDGRYFEIVNPDDRIPCQLVRDFYDATGDSGAAIKNCSESSVS